MNLALAAGALFVAGVAFLVRTPDSGERLDYAVAILFIVLGIIQGIRALVLYRQMSRYLRTGSASKLEDLVLAARNQRHPPPPPGRPR
jgi:branched-subunit amino acid ABC-type transport system permease component